MELRKTRRRQLPQGARRQFFACCLSLIVSLLGGLCVLPWTSHNAMATLSPSESLAMMPRPVQPETDVPMIAEPSPAAITTLAVDDPLPMPVQLAAVLTAMPEPTISAPPPPSAITFSDTVRQGDTAVVLLEKAGVDTPQAMALYRDVRKVYNLRHLSVGHAYHVQMDANGQVEELIYEIDHRKRLVVIRDGQGFTGEIKVIPHAISERLVVGELSNSIYATLKAQGESTRLIRDFADIFAASLDFDTDLRQGDSFRLLIEEHVREGEPAAYHRILAAELINRKRTLQTVYYDHDDIGGYYRPDGRSMQGIFLRSPLRYTRISSGYSPRRFHPILKRYRPHYGIDYAAPRGTPVRSVADGKVEWVGRKGANGKMVAIRHHQIYKSYYLHLSRFAPGLRTAKKVAQGQIIGYVGSTGMSTGPHLDFRLTKNGKYLNPLKHRSIEGPPMSAKALTDFRKHAQTMLTKLHQVQVAMQEEPKSANPSQTAK